MSNSTMHSSVHKFGVENHMKHGSIKSKISGEKNENRVQDRINNLAGSINMSGHFMLDN